MQTTRHRVPSAAVATAAWLGAGLMVASGCGGGDGGNGAEDCPGCVSPNDDTAGGAAAGTSGAGMTGGSGAEATNAGAGASGMAAGAGTAGTSGATAGSGAAGEATGGGSAAGTGTAGDSTGGTGGGDCVAAWTCSAWAELPDGLFERSCQDDNGCGGDADRPPEGPVALPALDEAYYRCNVQPIFDWGCAMLGCHGTETGRAFRHYAPGRLRNDEIVTRVTTCLPPTGTVNLQERASGTVMCEGRLPHTAEETRKNFDNARSFMLGVSDPSESELLAQPVVGGKAHAGVHLYRQGDARYQAIYDWLTGATGGACD